MDSLIPAYQELAKTAVGNFNGTNILHHVKSIKDLLVATKSKTMLDFGCGRGDAYRSPHKMYRELGLQWSDLTLYDPAFRKSHKLPTGTFDLVVCSDVCEHIPEHEVDEFVKRLFAYAKKGVWASVCPRAAKKSFPDGTNLHVTVKPYQWWHDTFNEHATCQWTLVETP